MVNPTEKNKIGRIKGSGLVIFVHKICAMGYCYCGSKIKEM